MGDPGLWLGEAAMTLTRNVDFEVPAVKKANARTQQQLIDLQRRQEEHLHSAAAAATAYKQVLACDATTAHIAKTSAETVQGLMPACLSCRPDDAWPLQECSELGVEGRNVEAELRGLGGLLEEQLGAAVQQCRSLRASSE